MSIKPATLRERFFSNLASIRKRNSEKKTNRKLVKRLLKRTAAKSTV